jgi:hypothetical protein
MATYLTQYASNSVTRMEHITRNRLNRHLKMLTKDYGLKLHYQATFVTTGRKGETTIYTIYDDDKNIWVHGQIARMCVEALDIFEHHVMHNYGEKSENWDAPVWYKEVISQHGGLIGAIRHFLNDYMVSYSIRDMPQPNIYSDENKELRQEIDHLKKMLAQEKVVTVEKEGILQNTIEKQKVRILNLLAKIGRYDKQDCNSCNIVADLKETVERLQSRLASREMDSAGVQELVRQRDLLQETLDRNRDGVRMLQKRVDDLSKERTELIEKLIQLEEMYEMNVTTEADQGPRAELEAQIKELTEERDHLRDDLGKAVAAAVIAERVTECDWVDAEALKAKTEELEHRAHLLRTLMTQPVLLGTLAKFFMSKDGGPDGMAEWKSAWGGYMERHMSLPPEEGFLFAEFLLERKLITSIDILSPAPSWALVVDKDYTQPNRSKLVLGFRSIP